MYYGSLEQMINKFGLPLFHKNRHNHAQSLSLMRFLLNALLFISGERWYRLVIHHEKNHLIYLIL